MSLQWRRTLGGSPHRPRRRAGLARQGAGQEPSAVTGSWQNDPVHSALEPASPTWYTWTTLAAASAMATTATTTPTQGGAPPDRRAIRMGTPHASTAATKRPAANQILSLIHI